MIAIIGAIALMSAPWAAVPFAWADGEEMLINADKSNIENSDKFIQSGDFTANSTDGGDARVEIDLDRSALSDTELRGEISLNIINNEDADFHSEAKIDGNAFRNARGVNQVAQNAGQTSLLQQNFTIQAPVVRDGPF
jgi:hypothetical protein